MKLVRFQHTLSEENFKQLFNVLQRKYPFAYKKFAEGNDVSSSLEQSLQGLLQSFKLELSCNETNALNRNFKGTYSYKLYFDETVARKLERKTLHFSYYGIKSFNSAFEKGLEKAFQVINCLLTGRTLPEQIRKF